jgi:hypothetical protein
MQRLNQHLTVTATPSFSTESPQSRTFRRSRHDPKTCRLCRAHVDAAVTSAKRLRGHRVHKDTLDFWRKPLAHARSRKRLAKEHQTEVEPLVAELQALVIGRYFAVEQPLDVRA